MTINFRTFLLRNITLQAFLLYELDAEDRAAAIADLLQLVAAGRLHHAIGARFPLAQIVAAHEAMEAGRVIGNVVVEIG